MMTKSDEEALDDRLRNWGRWAYSHVGSRSPNPIWTMMQRYGKPEKGEKLPPPREWFPQIDVVDAMKVERAWSMLPVRPPKYALAKWCLVAQFCYPHLPQHKVLHILRIGQKTFDQLLKMSKYMIFCRLEQHVGKKLTCLEI